MQPSGSSLVPASCGPSSCSCTMEEVSVRWQKETLGCCVLAPDALTSREFSSSPHWQPKSLDCAPLFLDREEHTWMKKRVRLGGGRGRESGGGAVTRNVHYSKGRKACGAEKMHGTDWKGMRGACRLAQPRSTSRDVWPGGGKWHSKWLTLCRSERAQRGRLVQPLRLSRQRSYLTVYSILSHETNFLHCSEASTFFTVFYCDPKWHPSMLCLLQQ